MFLKTKYKANSSVKENAVTFSLTGPILYSGLVWFGLALWILTAYQPLRLFYA